MSPQIIKFYAKHLKKSYGNRHQIRAFDAIKGDIWALGVCLFSMVAKGPPYGLPRDTSHLSANTAVTVRLNFLKQFLERIGTKKKRGSLGLPVSVQISDDCIGLLNELLDPDCKRRIDHFGVIHHKWVKRDLKTQTNPKQ
jgi:serine/threonine protein kinase